MEFILELISDLIDLFMAIPMLPWLVFPEEMAASHFSWLSWRWLLVVLIGCDIILFGIEYSLIWFLCRRFRIVQKIKTPRWLGRVAKNRSVSYPDLYIFGLTPQCHKFGVIALFARRHELGWRGFIALELGSLSRLLFYPLLGKYIFLLVGIFALLRIWEWQKQNGYMKRARKHLNL